ncbi:hypothetical protein [Neisseria wadsworthii]|uniref:hypothetical protein n=1 Tax=Neisseria wadsworthii TaxID=607711 RepID=UPI000D2F4BAB|nr:hypothetical protein [Neisseria wadsworthii]
MKLKYYGISLFIALICIILAFIFFIPYGFNFHEKEKIFDEAVISVIAPNRGERKVKLYANNSQYWLSCYGVDNICNSGNINKKTNIKNVKVLLNKEGDTKFLNGILLEYYDEKGYSINDKFNPKENRLISILAVNAIFSLKLSFIFLLISICFFIKRI